MMYIHYHEQRGGVQANDRIKSPCDGTSKRYGLGHVQTNNMGFLSLGFLEYCRESNADISISVTCEPYTLLFLVMHVDL